MPPVAGKLRKPLLFTLLAALCAGSPLVFRYLAAPSVTNTYSTGRAAALPRLILWAWERPERLDFINPEEVGVAYLARTIYLRGDGATVRPRLQPLSVPPDTRLLAVVRIETDKKDALTFSDKQLGETVQALVEASSAPGVVALQIDFDATLSERAFYRSLLESLRPRLPDDFPISITALASWCLRDDWISDLPVDEAVPMLFRMGVETPNFKSFISDGGAFAVALCRRSVGVSTDEPVATPRTAERVYVFNPRPWTPESLQRIKEALR